MRFHTFNRKEELEILQWLVIVAKSLLLVSNNLMYNQSVKLFQFTQLFLRKRGFYIDNTVMLYYKIL